VAHEEYVKIVPGTDTAVLCIHGILGSPDHFRDLLPLIPEEWSVCNVLLPGHGGTVQNFSRSSMEQWKTYIDEKVRMLLRDHKRIFIVAHSMGTLLALEQAMKDPEHIAGLFLLAAPLRLGIRWGMVENVWKVFTGNIDPSDHVAQAAKDSCSVEQDKRLWRYLGWVPRYLELFCLMSAVRRRVSQVSVPAIACQSRLDEMVSLRSLHDLKMCPSVAVTLLQTSRHYYYSPEDKCRIFEAFKTFCTH